MKCESSVTGVNKSSLVLDDTFSCKVTGPAPPAIPACVALLFETITAINLHLGNHKDKGDETVSPPYGLYKRTKHCHSHSVSQSVQTQRHTCSHGSDGRISSALRNGELNAN